MKDKIEPIFFDGDRSYRTCELYPNQSRRTEQSLQYTTVR